MKNTALLLSLITLISCSPFTAPESSERALLNEEIKPTRIVSFTEELISSGKDLTVYASPKGPEALELLSYIIPLLHNRDNLVLRLWFLDNNGDEEIKDFLESAEGAPEAADLLRRANPILCGFESYSLFLENLKLFYHGLENPDSLVITASDDVDLDFRLYNGQFLPKGDRLVYLVHSPLPKGSDWELPFQGLLYSMMIHEWPLKKYAAVSVSDNPLGASFLTEDDARNNSIAADRVDGLFLMSYPMDYTGMTRIENFINESGIAEVLEFFPRQLIREKTKPATYLADNKIGSRHRKDVRRLTRLYDAVKQEIPGYGDP